MLHQQLFHGMAQVDPPPLLSHGDVTAVRHEIMIIVLTLLFSAAENCNPFCSRPLFIADPKNQYTSW